MIKEDIRISVGKDKPVELEAAVYEPSGPGPYSNVVFIPGVPGHFKDYHHLLEPLADQSRILTYNLRGHGKSEGEFLPGDLCEDLESILDKEQDSIVIGHSMGAGVTFNNRNHPKMKGAYLLTPFLDKNHIGSVQTGFIKLMKALYALPGPLQLLDETIDTLGLQKYMQTHNRQFFHDWAKCTELEQENKTSQTPAGWMLSDADHVIGTLWSDKTYRKIQDYLHKTFQNGQDDSNLVKGLNHCLNRSLVDVVPFLRPEKGKDQKAIIETIQEFVQTNS